MKIKFTVLILLFSAASAIFPQNIIEQVKLDTLKQYVRELSGDTPCTIGGSTYSLPNRVTTNQSFNYMAADYIKFRLQSYGLTAKEQTFTFTKSGNTYYSKNIYAEQTGTKYPAKKYIICAHFDAVSVSPGADDNGSGTCAVLEAARILSKLSPECTIVYAFWNGEEQGLKGSYHYAYQAYQNNENIAGVINLDMIAWDYDGDKDVEIYSYKPVGKEALMTDLIEKVNLVNHYYSLGLNIRNVGVAYEDSDHYSFLYYGFPALLLIEEDSDFYFNHNYHTSNDKYSEINQDYFERCTKLGVGTIAEASGIVNSSTSVENNEQVPAEFALNQNYPNPFNPSTVISYSLKTAGYVNLKVFDMLGREVKTLVNQYQSAGKHQVSFSAQSNQISSGIYLYKLQAGNLSQIRKMVYNK